MKKLLTLAVILSLSTTVSATTLELSGLDKIKAKSVELLDFEGHICETYWDCGIGEVAFNIATETLPSRMRTINSKINGKLLTKDYKGAHSSFFLKFAGYANTCKVILTYRKNVNIVLSEDGSCQSKDI